MKSLSNPEAHWRPPEAPRTVTPAEIRARVGQVDADWLVLGGGHANTNVRLGDGRILRIYRRDASAAATERSLLERPWTALRVPTVLDGGDDFLVLEDVAHAPLEASRQHGAAVGEALAEIHRNAFEQAGFLGPKASSVDDPFDDVLADFFGYIDGRGEVASQTREQVLDFLRGHRANLEALAEAPVLLHGDFKVSNLHWTLDDRLLVLDWEFAYAGPALMDVGQLMRWDPPDDFCDAFADAYRGAGASLSDDWRRWADTFDLVNLVGLLDGAPADSRRASDVQRRIEMTLGDRSRIGLRLGRRAGMRCRPTSAAIAPRNYDR